MKTYDLLSVATGVALGRISRYGSFKLAAVGIRGDGALVQSHNGSATQVTWKVHAEARLCRKLTPHSVVAVVRIFGDGTWALAKPCKNCQTCMRRVGVTEVLYSIASDEYGVLRL